MSGALCFRVSTLFDHLEVGELDEFYVGFPSVGPEMVEAVLDVSRRLIEDAVKPSLAATDSTRSFRSSPGFSMRSTR